MFVVKFTYNCKKRIRMTEKFGERLKNLRKSANCTQQELADRVNVHLQTVSKWERDVCEPDIAILGDIAKALDISVEKLCGIDDASEVFVGTFETVAFGEALSRARKGVNKSQEEVASDLGVSSDTVSKWERGVTCPDINFFINLANYFHTPPSKLYYGIKEEEQTEEVKYLRKRKFPVAIVCVTSFFLVCIAVLLFVLVPKTIKKTFTVSVIGSEETVYTVGENEWFTPTEPKKYGYDFVRFENEDGEEVAFPYKIVRNEKFTAIFELHDYNIEYWTNGGEFTQTAEYTFNVESQNITLLQPVKSGATFDGWYYSCDYSGEAVTEISCNGEDITLYAKWSDGSYGVHYVLNGGECDSNPQTVTCSEEVTLKAPSRNGYEFLGWYDGENGGTLYEKVGGANAKNVTLYALWQKVYQKYNITYELYGGTLTNPNPTEVWEGEIYTLVSPQKDGYDFLGWNLSPDGSGEYITVLKNLNSDTALYAIYQPRKYVLIYEYDGVYTQGTNPSFVVFGDEFDLKPVQKQGHDFVGWFDKSEGGNKITRIDSSNIINLTCLYARYTPKVYTINLNAQNGTFSTEQGEAKSHTYNITYGETLTLPTCQLDGFEFVGWFDGDGNAYTQIDSENICSTKLFAHYADVTGYPVSYELDGGSFTQANPDRAFFGQSQPLYEAERTGYIFLGWNDKAGGAGLYHSKTPADISAPLTLYAIWQEIKVNASTELFTYEKGASSVTITQYTGESGEFVDLVFPTLIDGLPVTDINLNGSLQNLTFRSVTVPEGVKSLGAETFTLCKILQPITLPASLESMGDYCFANSVVKLNFAEGCKLTAISTGAFQDADIKNVVILPQGLKTIGARAFHNGRIMGVIIPDGVTAILGKAFYDTVYPNLFIPGSVKVLGSEVAYQDNVYTALTEAPAGTPENWSHMSPVYSFTGNTVTLVDGDTTQTITAPVIALPKPNKVGFTFLGWKDAQGNFVNDCYITAKEGEVLYACYEERSGSDGRSANSPIMLSEGANAVNVITYGKPLYLSLDTQTNCSVMISFGGYDVVLKNIATSKTDVTGGISVDYKVGDIYSIEMYDDNFYNRLPVTEVTIFVTKL